jgi:SAM-dependent methyltransferase
MPLDYREDPRYGALTSKQVWDHFEVERELRQRMLAASAADRPEVIQRAYDELFERVPWHPALTEASGAEAPDLVKRQAQILKWMGPPPARILEIGCGMGEFALGASRQGYDCVGIDVSEERIRRLQALESPTLRFVRVDGRPQLPFGDGSFDFAVSMQLLEHLHPGDVPLHAREVARVLRRGGSYLVETPNRLTGPHDVSRFFTESAQGFHLKEYRVSELARLFLSHGFDRVDVVRWRAYRLSAARAIWLERMWSVIPKRARRRFPLGINNPLYVATVSGGLERHAGSS